MNENENQSPENAVPPIPTDRTGFPPRREEGKFRFRYVYMGLFSILTLLALFITDPDSKILTSLPIAAGFVATITLLTSAVLYVTLLHLSRRGLFDYIDLSDYFIKALNSPTGAGLALVGIGLSNIAIAIVILASVIGSK